MFSTDHNISKAEELFREIKHYLELQKEYVTLEFVSRLIVLLSSLILGLILFLISGVAFIMIAFFLSSLIGDLCCSQTAGYAVVAGFFVLVVILVYLNRRRWITAPVVKFLSRLFLS